MRIFLTGINGFVGASLCKNFFHTDHEIIGLVRDKRVLPLEILDKYKIIQGDINKGIQDVECDVLIHCAALTEEFIMSPLLNKTNVDGFKKLLESISPNARIIYLSSSDIYNLGPAPHIEIESSNIALLDSQGRSKFAAEKMLRSEFADRDITILRPAMIYGKGDTKWLTKILTIKKGNTIRPPGSLDCYKSMCHIDLLVETIDYLLSEQKLGLHTINVADQTNYSWKKVILDLYQNLYKEDFEILEKSEVLSRIRAGLTTVLRPGKKVTQSNIDFFTKTHIINTSYLQEIDAIEDRNFHEYLPEYIEWINSVGLQKILTNDFTVKWL